MPNILFASNNISHWPTAVTGSVPNTYDDTRVPYSIALSNFEVVSSPVFQPSSGEDTWFHFRMFSNNTTDYNGTPTLFKAFAPDGTLLLHLYKRGSSNDYGVSAQIFDGTTHIGGDSTLNFNQGKLSFIDIKYTVTNLKLEAMIYINGALGLTLTMNSNPNGLVNPTYFSIGCAYAFSSTDTQHVSEILVADGDTRNARLDLLRPTAAGAYGEWSGSLADIADDDPTTGMSTVAANQRQTVTLTPYGGANNISNLVLVSQTTRGQNSPTGLKHSIRLSGVDYDSSTISVDHALQYNLTDYKINPGTSLPWEGTDLSAIETGFVSVV